MKRIAAILILAAVVTLWPGPVQAQAAPTFVYVVTTIDVNGFESVFSNQVTVTFAQGQHITSLTWVAPAVPTGGSAVSGYNIYRGTVSGGPYARINPSLVTAVTFQDIFVPPVAVSGLAATKS